MVLNELKHFLRHPIKRISNAMDYDELARQHTNNINKHMRLIARQRETIKEAKELREKVGGLEDSIGELTGQKARLAKELAEAQTQLLQYTKEITESPEYKNLQGEKNTIEAKVGKLEKQVSDLKKGCAFRQETINSLQIRLREYDKEKINQIEHSYKQRAEGPDKGHSYMVIGGHSRIVASTPEFRKGFSYNDPNKPIENLHYFKVLRIPEDSPDYISQKQMKELLKNPEEIKLTTTIIDGRGEEKIIRFTKHAPEYFKVGNYKHFYTRVDIYEVGIVKRTFGGILRTLHIINGQPQTIAEFFKNAAIKDIQSEGEKQKNEILSAGIKAKDKPPAKI